MATNDSAATREKAQAQLDALVAERHAPGIGHAVVTADQSRFEGYAGVLDAAGELAVGPRTMYMGCSTTKVLTAIAVMQLVERGALQLDAPLSGLVEHPYGDAVTARLLLTHTAGVPSPAPLDWFFVEGEPLDHDGAYQAAIARASKLADPPGARYRYTNLGYWLLGVAIEKATGADYATAVRTNIFQPLGLDETAATFALPAKDALATGHIRKWSVTTAVFFLLTPRRYWAEAASGWSRSERLVHHGLAYGGVYISVAGFAAVLQDLLKADSRLLGPASKAALFEDQRDANGRALGQALGWVIGEVEGERYFGKQGGAFGYHGNVRIYPERGVGTVFFANSTRVTPGPIDRVSDRLDRAFLR